MKHISYLLFAIITVLLVAACTPQQQAASEVATEAAPTVVTLKVAGSGGTTRVLRAIEGAFEAVLPTFERSENGEVGGFERIGARLEDVGEFTFVDEYGNLRFADDELRVVFNFVAVAIEAVNDHDVDLALGGVVQHPSECGPVAFGAAVAVVDVRLPH